MLSCGRGIGVGRGKQLKGRTSIPPPSSTHCPSTEPGASPLAASPAVKQEPGHGQHTACPGLNGATSGPQGWRGRDRVTVPLSALETASSCPFQRCSAGRGWKMSLETKHHTLVPQHTVLIKSRTKHYPSLIIIIIPGRSNCWGYFKLQSTRYFENRSPDLPRVRW